MSRIAVFGAGYVGLSLACLFARKHEVVLVDVIEEKVTAINAGRSPIADTDISRALSKGHLNLTATLDSGMIDGLDYAFIATPTNYDSKTNAFDTSSIESVLDGILSTDPNIHVIIKSTVPVGYTAGLSESHPQLSLFFSPEFLREGHALHDNLYPSRIIVGVPPHGDKVAAEEISRLLSQSADIPEDGVSRLVMGSTEAEAVKLFANTYLALRVSYFNELDTYAEARGLDTRSIIEGVCLDPRIGDFYNNPSFGYGGYCLPKDSKQLLANFADVPQNLIRAIVDSNETRKEFVTSQIAARRPRHVGVYRLIMKAGSDNFRETSVGDVIKKLMRRGIEVTVYEPALDATDFLGAPVSHDLPSFKEGCDLIICNRMTDELDDVIDKVYTRDLWHRE